MELIDKAWLQAEITRHFEIMVRGDDINDVVCAIRGKDLKAIIDKAPTFKNLEVVVRCKDCANWSDRYQKLFENRTVKLKFCEANEHMTTPDFYCAFGEERDVLNRNTADGR